MCICSSFMPAKIEERKILKQTEFAEPVIGNNSFGGLKAQSESEIRWIKLHQMFDK